MSDLDGSAALELSCRLQAAACFGIAASNKRGLSKMLVSAIAQKLPKCVFPFSMGKADCSKVKVFFSRLHWSTISCSKRAVHMIAFLAGVVTIYLSSSTATARDLGQWSNTDPDLRAWYESLKRPDVPTMSCCGVADAYFCDEYRMEGGKAVCTITGDRPDEPRKRPHVPVGTVIEIPPAKLMREGGNPTGHGVVFMTRDRYVWCYVTGGGV